MRELALYKTVLLLLLLLLCRQSVGHTERLTVAGTVRQNDDVVPLQVVQESSGHLSQADVRRPSRFPSGRFIFPDTRPFQG